MSKIYGNAEIWGDLLVSGSFSVLGSASVVDTTSLVVSDPIIALGHSQSGSPSLDEGFMFVRGTGLTQAFIWDETNDTFAMIGTNDDHTVVGSVNINSYSNLRVGGLTTSTFKMSNGAVNGYFLQSDASGNATWTQISGGLTGSGATNYVSKWLNSSTLTSSNIYDNGTNVGIGTTSPLYPFHVVSSTGSFYFRPTSSGTIIGISASSEGIFQIAVTIPPYLSKPLAGGSVGLRSWNESTFPGYGKVGDMFIYASDDTNGLNIINQGPGTGTEDYIRFYAGRDASPAYIPDLHIHGQGSTRGNIGIGVTGPNYKLEVSGTVSTTGFRMTNGAVNGYYLKSDASGNATWASIPIGISGSGTTNNVARWSSSNSLTDSLIYDTGSVIGINSYSSQHTLGVYSNVENNAISAANANLTTTNKTAFIGSVSGKGKSLQNVGIRLAAEDGANSNFSIYANTTGASGSNNYGAYILNNSTGLTNYGVYIDSNSGTTNYGLVVNTGTSVFNESGNANTDFRIEGDTDSNLFFVDASNNNIGIGTNTPNSSAILQLSSTTKGFLPPKMTATQAESISSPAEGLIVYSTDGTGVTITSKGWWGYTGATWTQIAW